MGDEAMADRRARPAGKPLEPRWEYGYAGVFAVGALVVGTGPLSTAGRVAAGAALAAMVPWYVAVLRPVLRPSGARSGERRRSGKAASGERRPATERSDAAGPRGPLGLAVLIALFGVVQALDPAAWLLAFALVPICFRVTASVRTGMVFVVVLNVLAGLLVLARRPGPDGTLAVLGIAVFSIGVSYAVRRWMLRVIAVSEERAALIEQLESTRAELAAAHHEAGMLAERHRLAGEIHDTLAQGFTSVVTLLQAALANLAPEEPARGHLDLALATARENLAEARTLVAGHGPALLAEHGLGDALRRAAESAAATGGMRARAEVAGAGRPLPAATEVVLLRVCQEALANARRHAAASRVEVLLRYRPNAVELTVADDGCGFDPQAVAGGHGLRGMRERVRQVGGSVTVRSAPGQGTQIRAEVPG